MQKLVFSLIDTIDILEYILGIFVPALLSHAIKI